VDIGTDTIDTQGIAMSEEVPDGDSKLEVVKAVVAGVVAVGLTVAVVLGKVSVETLVSYDAELKRCVDLSRSFEEYERCANDVDRRYR
jgi:hypothetical protein